MVEYSFHQLMGVCCSVMEICRKQHFSVDELDGLRVRLLDPKPNGDVDFDLGIPRLRKSAK